MNTPAGSIASFLYLHMYVVPKPPYFPPFLLLSYYSFPFILSYNTTYIRLESCPSNYREYKGLFLWCQGAVPKRDGTQIYIGITKSVVCVTGDSYGE